MPELPEVEALVVGLRERAVGRVVERGEVAEFSVLKTYEPPLGALDGLTVVSAGRHGKFLDLGLGARLGLAAGYPRFIWSCIWLGAGGCGGARNCRRRRRGRGAGRWRSGCGSPTGRGLT